MLAAGHLIHFQDVQQLIRLTTRCSRALASGLLRSSSLLRVLSRLVLEDFGSDLVLKDLHGVFEAIELQKVFDKRVELLVV